MLRHILMAACLVGLAACGKKYPLIPRDVPAAQLHVTRVEGTRVWRGVSTQLWIYENPDCTETATSGALTLMTFSNDGGVHRIPVARRIYVISNTSTSAYEPGVMTDSECANQISFIPEAGRRYELRAAGVGVACGVGLTESSGEVPASLTISRPPRTCTAFVNALEERSLARE
jgi:hypothetical protein